MANLTDSIKLNTEVDLNGLINLIQEFKDLGIKVKDVAAASRALTEQIKRDNLQQVNSVKLSVLEHDKVTAALINEDKVEEQVSKSSTARSKKKKAEIDEERTSRKNSQEQLLELDVIQQGLNKTQISDSNKIAAAENAEAAAINKKRTARRDETEERLKDSNIQKGLDSAKISSSNAIAAAERAETAEKQKNISIIKEGTAVINQGTAATKQDNAELQKKRQTVQLSTDEEKLYNAQLRNRALESKNAQKSSDELSASIGSLTKVGTGFLAIFGIDTLGSFARRMIDAQSSVQAFGLSMKNLIGDAYGEKLTNDLKQFTVNTPLNFEEVIKSTNQLVGSFKAAGVSSKTIGTEIPQILESIGNSAAALGGDDRMGRLVYAFSQVQATGRLMGTEVRQITETGFPMLAVLTQSLNERFPKLALSVSDVQKRVSDGNVSFEDFKIALLSAGQAGGVFAGGMEARMKTVAGSLDKLQESTFFALANIGNQFNDTAKSVIDFGTSIVKSLFGTNDAAERTVDVVSNLTKIYLGYRAAVALVATGTAIKNAYDSASLVVQGLLMRAKAGLNLQTQRDITLTAESVIARATATAATGATTVAIDGMTLAEARAAIATRSLTAAFGVIAIVLGVAYAAYEIYKSTVEDTDAKQKELNEKMALGIAPIKESQSEFNRLANALKNSSDATQEKTTKLQALKEKFPEQLKGINDLATAEKLLGDKANDTNIVKDYRLKLFNQLKTKFPEQTKGLKDVKDSESKLSTVMREVNGDFMLRQQLMKDEIAINMNREKINIFLTEQIKLENQLKTASKEKRVVSSVEGAAQKSEYDQIQEAIAARSRWVLHHQETNAKIAENSIKTTAKLKYNWEEQNKDANKAGKEQADGAETAGKDKKEKTLKYQAETIMQGKILDEIAFRKSLESSRENDENIRRFQKVYDDNRLKEAVGTKAQKHEAELKLEHDFNNDMANIKRTWDAKDKAELRKAQNDKLKGQGDYYKASIDLEKSKNELSEKIEMLKLIMAAKSSKEIEKIEQKTADNILELNKISAEDQLKIEEKKLEEILKINGKDSLEYIKQHKIVLESTTKLTNAEIALTNLKSNIKKKATKEEEELYAKLLKLDEDNAKESVKLEDDKYKLMDKLRILQLISKAKNSDEVIKIQNKENEKILKEEVDSTAKRLAQEKARLVAMAMLGQQNTEEYKKQQGVILKLDGESTAAQTKNAEFLTGKQKDEIEKRNKLEEDALNFILKSTDIFFGAINSALDDSISKAGDLVTKAQLENKKAVLSIAQQGLSAAVSIGKSIATGDYFGAATAALGFVVNSIGSVINAKKRLNEAKLETARKTFEDYAKIVSDGVDKIISRIDDIKEAYGAIKLPNGNTLGLSLSKDLQLDTSLKYLSDVQSAINQLSNRKFKFAGADLTQLATLLRISRESLEEFIANNSDATKTVINSLQAILTYSTATGKTYSELINGVIDAAQQTQKIYETNVSNENKLNETNLSNNQKVYDDKVSKLNDTKEKGIAAANTTYDNEIDKINKAYDLSVKNINARFDLEATRANQKYDAETLSILQSGSKQLEALITNEVSLNSVRSEFDGKRKFILDSYALANKTITADMSQEEINGINNAIKARDAALAKLQKWYNDELTAISTSEGQKRKEYTDTEKIRNDINDRLEKAAIVFDANEIARNANKNVELAAAQKTKDDAADLAYETRKTTLAAIDTKYATAKDIEDKAFNKSNEDEKERHDKVIVTLNNKRDKDIADSYAILTALLEGYSQQISDAIISSVDKGSDAYQKLKQDLIDVNNLLNQIKGNVYTNPLTIPVVNGLVAGTPLEKGTDDTSVALKGQRVVDNKGGWQAILHPQEAVFSKADMTQMETVFGKRPTRQEVIENFKIGVVNQVTPQMNPFVIQKVQANGIGNFDKLSGEIRSLAKEVSKKMSPVVYVDKGGIRTYYKNLNSQIEVKNQRFK